MKKGFTLLELLAVIVILSILVVLAVPKVTEILETSKQKTYETNKEVIEKAAKKYFLYNPDKTLVSSQTLVNNKLLVSVPKNPKTGLLMDGVVVLEDKEVEYQDDYAVKPYNIPELSDNMYPVKWDGNNWVVTVDNDIDWYSYNGDINNLSDIDKDDGIGAFTIDKWANIQVSNAILNEGDIIDESNLNLYVWIPRYTYLLDESSKSIAIKYSIGLDDDNEDGYLSHPGFSFGDENLKGIWVAKFEMSANVASNSSGSPSGDAFGVSAPNKKPWRTITVNNIFNEARSLESEFSLNFDSHMIKSSEWAAVAYLTEAIRDGEKVWVNNQGDGAKFLVTGCVSSVSNNSSDNNATEAICPSGYDYKTGGVKASTTGNIYGIYDMVGGAWEYVATYINDNTNSRLTNVSGAKALNDSEYRYKEMFDIQGSNPTTNYNAVSEMTKGLAIHETCTSQAKETSWYKAYYYFMSSGSPVMIRGGAYSSGSNSGIFSFTRHYAGVNSTNGWRAVLV